MPALAACVLGTAPACEGERPEVTQQRRQLLLPPDRQQKRDERRRALQLFDDEGKLLASETRVAEVLLPKGLTEYRRFEYEWYFKTKRVPAEKIVDYFKRRLMPSGVGRSKTGSVTFTNARIRDRPNARMIEVQVDPLKGADNATSVYIRQAPPAPVYKSGKEAEAQLEALRRHAE